VQDTLEPVRIQHYAIRCLREILHIHDQGDELAPTTDLEAQALRPPNIEEHERCAVILAEFAFIQAVVEGIRASAE